MSVQRSLPVFHAPPGDLARALGERNPSEASGEGDLGSRPSPVIYLRNAEPKIALESPRAPTSPPKRPNAVFFRAGNGIDPSFRQKPGPPPVIPFL